MVHSQPFDEFDPAPVGQANVHQRDPEAPALEQLHGRRVIVGPRDLRLVASEHRQNVVQTLLHGPIVFDHERRAQGDGFNGFRKES